MKIFRFMSKEEFDKFRDGEILKNNKAHKAFTTSAGFCFMNTTDYDPEYAYEFLNGIVSSDVCAIFETNESLKKSCGVYAEPYGSFWDSFTATEYCIEEYSKSNFKLIEFCYDFEQKGNAKWTWIGATTNENV